MPEHIDTSIKPFRLAGCQSTNHTECYGELWTCEKCGKKVCYQEGSSLDPDICDDCFVEKHKEKSCKST